MNRVEKDELEKRNELEFWQRMYEVATVALLHSTTRPRTYCEVADEATMLADVSVAERRRFIDEKQR